MQVEKTVWARVIKNVRAKKIKKKLNNEPERNGPNNVCGP